MITSYVFVWSVITGSFFILLLHILLKNTDFLIRHGLGIIILCCVLCLLRITVPVQFVSCQYELLYPSWISWIMKPRYLFHGQLPLSYVLAIFSLFISMILFVRYILRARRTEKVLWTYSSYSEKGSDILHSIDPDCPVPVRTSRLLKSPVVVGYLHPVIYIADARCSEEDLMDMLRHEYMHWKHHHLIIKLFVWVLTCIFWWDPFIYILQKDIVHLIELICDEEAMYSFDSTQKFHYISTLLSCMRHSVKESPHPEIDVYSLEFASMVNHFSTRQRISYHLNHEKKLSKATRFLNYGMCVFAFLWVVGSYYIIVQPAFEPAEVESYSNEDNSYLVELADGSYQFHYEDVIVDATNEDVEQGYYDIYRTIPYSEYEDLDSYVDSKTYQKYFAK